MKSRTRLKQRISQRNIAIGALFFLSASSLSLILFLNLNNPERLHAKTAPTVNAIVVKDQELVTEKNINEIRIQQQKPQPGTARTIYVRSVIRTENPNRD